MLHEYDSNLERKGKSGRTKIMESRYPRHVPKERTTLLKN
jgi:hypothetical protein